VKCEVAGGADGPHPLAWVGQEVAVEAAEQLDDALHAWGRVGGA
jgi:hypothetical protein